MGKYYKFKGKRKSKSTSRWPGIDTRHPHHHFKSKMGVYDYIEKYKENIPLIASLILILGGSTQLIILFNLDPRLIRFFSGSQMLVDGLILSTAVLSVYFLARLVYYVEANYALLRFLGVTIFLVFNLINRPDFEKLYLSIPFIWSIIAMLYFFFLMLRHEYRFNSYEVGKVTKNRMILISILLYTTGIIFFAGIGYFWFTKIKNIYNVEEISNYANVECYLEKEPYSIKDYKVLYYNDSYMFIQIMNCMGKELKVYPISILLDSAPCKENLIN